MATRIRFYSIFMICVALLSSSPGWALKVTKSPVPGVVFSQDINIDPNSPRIVNLVTVDMVEPTLAVKAVLGRDDICNTDPSKGREVVSSMVGRNDAIAGINGDYFPFTGDPLGLCIVGGEFVSEPTLGRAAMGITKSRTVVFDNPRLDAKLTLAGGIYRQIDGINRVRDTNQVVFYSDTFGPSTTNKYKATDIICTTTDLPVQLGKSIKLKVTEVRKDSTDTQIPKGGVVISGGGPAAFFLNENIKPGDEITVQFDLKSGSDIDWKTVDQAIGAGPWLVKNGVEFVDNAEEGFAPAFETTTHPRTAVGVTSDNKLLLVTVDGRQELSKGVGLKDMAAVMLKLGAVNAINLDGGGSTTMSMRGMVVNSPCEGIERAVANALIVTSLYKEQELSMLKIKGVDEIVAAGQTSKVSLSWGKDNLPLSEDQLKRVVWGVTGGVGFVNQEGFFIPMNARKGTVKALYGTQMVSVDVSVVPGEPKKISGKLTPDSLNPNLSTFKVNIEDTFGNPVPDKEIAISVVGGTSDLVKGNTNANGEFVAVITWTPGTDQRTATASVGALNITIKAPSGAADIISVPAK